MKKIAITLCSLVSLIGYAGTSKADCSRCNYGACEPSNDSREVCQVKYGETTCEWSISGEGSLGAGPGKGGFGLGLSGKAQKSCKETQRCEAVASCQPPTTCRPSVYGATCGWGYF